MDTLSLITFAVALTSLLGAFIVPILNNRTRWIELNHIAKQDEQKERVALFRDTQAKLIDLLGQHEHETWQAAQKHGLIRPNSWEAHPRDEHVAKSNSIMRTFVAITFSIQDAELYSLAEQISKAHGEKDGDTIITLSNKAIIRLGEMINQEMKLVPPHKPWWRFW